MRYFCFIVWGFLSFFYLNATPGDEIAFAKRVHDYLVSERSSKGARSVGPALKRVIEGKARDKEGSIPGNREEVGIIFQKKEISKHLREHRHFGSDKSVLRSGEHFTKKPAYPSFFRIDGVSSPERVEEISDALIDLLLSGSMSILIEDMEGGCRANRL